MIMTDFVSQLTSEQRQLLESFHLVRKTYLDFLETYNQAAEDCDRILLFLNQLRDDCGKSGFDPYGYTATTPDPAIFLTPEQQCLLERFCLSYSKASNKSIGDDRMAYEACQKAGFDPYVYLSNYN